MYRIIICAYIFFFSVFVNSENPSRLKKIDVCVYGGTSAGVIAAYAAAKLHKNVVLIEPGKRLGGLSSGGLGFTDIGNKYVVTGLARDFYRKIGNYYGSFEQWTFEPKAAEAVFKEYIEKGNIKVLYQCRLKKVHKIGSQIVSVTLENISENTKDETAIIAKQYIDCTYEGDLMAKAGVRYTIGRESNSVYHETVNGVQLKNKHQFPDNIDPYKTPGEPASGLLWGVSPKAMADEGSGDNKVQAYNFRICLTDNPANKVEISRPQDYHPERYALLLRYLASRPSKDLSAFLKIDIMPNHKTDINNNGPFSTDMIGMNYAYADGDYATRDRIFKAHEVYTKGLLYFIGHDSRMPEHLRNLMLKWGYPKDEYPESNHWTPQLYVREARRMIGDYIMTQANCQRKEIVKDGIGQAAYAMDSHNAQRMVIRGMVKNEGDVQIKDITPYPISYRSITPKKNECSNLLVPVCLSASHMAYGSIRMEPVFMVLGQSSAYAACQAIDKNLPVQNIDIGQLQSDLKSNPLADNSLPEILVDNDDKKSIQSSGVWKRMGTDGYGPSYLLSSRPDDGRVKFLPSIRKTGVYQVYLYFPKLRKNASATSIQIFDGKKNTGKTIHNNDINVIGQTSGEWIFLYSGQFLSDKKAYVEITTKNADGPVTADAVLFIPAMK